MLGAHISDTIHTPNRHSRESGNPQRLSSINLYFPKPPSKLGQSLLYSNSCGASSNRAILNNLAIIHFNKKAEP